MRVQGQRDIWKAAIIHIGQPAQTKSAFVVGWPWRSLGAQSEFGPNWSGPLDKSTGFEGTVGGVRFVFPLAPIWPGFALNTLFYAAIAWGLWQVPLAIRRRRRVRRGQCPRCGYDRAGIAAATPCPECGAAA